MQSGTSNPSTIRRRKVIGAYGNLPEDEIPDDHQSYVDRIETIREELPSRYSAIQYVKQTILEIRRSKLTYCLGFLACFIVVFVVALMLSILSHAPIVFLRLAELEEGEIDIRLTPRSSTGYDFLNYTQITELLQEQEEYTYSTVRYHWDSDSTITFYKARDCASIRTESNFTQWVYKGILGYTFPNCTTTPNACFSAICGNKTSSETLLIDSEREWDIRLGHEWPKQGEPIPLGEFYMSRDMRSSLDIHTGDLVYVRINLQAIYHGLWRHSLDEFLASDLGEEYTYEDTLLWQWVYAPFIASWTFPDIYGKSSSDYENLVFFEYSTFMKNFQQNFHPDMPQLIQDLVMSWNPYEYAKEIIFNFPPQDRYDVYTDSNLQHVDHTLVDFTEALAYTLGFNQINLDLPVLKGLNRLEIFSLFLGLILNVITFILLFLSVLLIYSLLMVSVETRTFEMGILRMVGMTRGGVIQLLLIQAFAYSLPAVISGIIFAEIGGYVAGLYFVKLTGIPIDTSLTWEAFFAACFIGMVIPVISAIFPILNALRKNLHDALDVRHSKAKAVEIRVERASDASMSLPLLATGTFLAVFGFGIYYVIPLSLLAEQFAMLLNMFFALLIMMLLGLVMLALNFQRVLEISLVQLLFWWDRAAIRSVVLKNMIAHRLRNRKTTIMYALSLGFIIFIYVSYDVQMKSFLYQQQWEGGSYISAQIHFSNYKQSDLVLKFETWAKYSPYVLNFAWATQPLRQIAQNVSSSYISNLGHVFDHWTDVYGISPNIFEVCIPGYLSIHSMNKSSPYSLVEQLYTPIGSGAALTGTLFRTDLNLQDLDGNFLIRLSKRNGYSDSFHRFRVSAYLDGAPFFFFSKFPTFPRQDLLVSFPTMLELTEGAFSAVDELPMGSFFIKIQEGLSDSQLDSIVRDLKNIGKTSNVSGISVVDYRRDMGTVEEINLAMQFFFGFTVVTAMAISFFSLISSMFTNVHEQAKEIGILRALGIPYGWMQRIYVYEAFTLVFSSSLMGMAIGIGVGWTVAIQRVLFTQLPVPFEFPWELFLIVFSMSIIFSILSSYGPITVIMNRPVVSILRML